jgi:hypothetical protein
MPKAAAVTAVLITDIEATPDCVASRSLLPRSWPTEPTMVAPMATALIGVQASQPVLATRPALLGSDASPAARLSATALANVPPNQAARPRSCSNREGKFGTLVLLMFA